MFLSILYLVVVNKCSSDAPLGYCCWCYFLLDVLSDVVVVVNVIVVFLLVVADHIVLLCSINIHLRLQETALEFALVGSGRVDGVWWGGLHSHFHVTPNYS